MNESSQLTKLNEQIEQVEQKIKDPRLCCGTANVSTRVSGYYRSVETFNAGKQQEVKERAQYKIVG